jgi:threonine-phosphate decarboxylase
MIAEHGGDLLAIAREFGCDPTSLRDLSANVNPLGPPAGVLDVLREVLTDPARLTRYPDPQAAAFAAVAAGHAGVDAARIVVGNGGAAVLDAAVRGLGAVRCVLPVPAFSEDARALRTAQTEIVPFALQADDDFALDPQRLLATVRDARADLCLLTNPHNPSGALLARGAMMGLVGDLAVLGCAAIVDEAFIDYVPEASIVSGADPGWPLVVLRSVTKFYAMAGVRIGYAIASHALASRVRAMLPSWPTGIIEQRAAAAALADVAYADRTRHENRRARGRFIAALDVIGVRALPAAANYLLLDVSRLVPDALALRARLIRTDGLVVRAFPNEPTLRERFVRVAVRSSEDNAHLVAALARAVKEKNP